MFNIGVRYIIGRERKYYIKIGQRERDDEWLYINKSNGLYRMQCIKYNNKRY